RRLPPRYHRGAPAEDALRQDPARHHEEDRRQGALDNARDDRGPEGAGGDWRGREGEGRGGVTTQREFINVLFSALFFFLAPCANADELPRNLLLKCEGKVLVLFPEMAPKHDKFESMLRLKDGELSDTAAPWLNTKHCTLQNAIVHCSDDLVVAS